MGSKVTNKLDILASLTAENPHAPAVSLRIYADALTTYREAAANITANGAICAHPRTGAPIENPYLKVRTQAGAMLAKLFRIKSDKTLRALEIEDAAAATSPRP